MRRWTRVALPVGVVLAMSAGLLAVGTAVGAPSPSAPPATVSSAPPVDELGRLRAAAQAAPDSAAGWAALGFAELDRSRSAADPSAYGRAERAFARSLESQPQDNDRALAGQAALAAARHEFAEALRLTDAALAINDFSATTYGVRTDALVELGRYEQALVTVERMLELAPSVASLTRASYAAELRGEVDRAGQLLQQAAGMAAEPAETAFAEHYLGELAWNAGDLPAARTHYDAALAADPDHLPSLAARGKVLAASGDLPAGLADYREAVRRVPLPQHLVELGELLEAGGQAQQAKAQYAVVRATQQLFAAQGSDVDLELALFEADHGDPATALSYARKAYAARPQAILVQDAYAWALHRAGRSREALPIARQAVRLGTRLPTLHHHLGVLAAAAGDEATARTALRTALDLNPAFNPLQAPEARRLLGTLG